MEAKRELAKEELKTAQKQGQLTSQGNKMESFKKRCAVAARVFAVSRSVLTPRRLHADFLYRPALPEAYDFAVMVVTTAVAAWLSPCCRLEEAKAKCAVKEKECEKLQQKIQELQEKLVCLTVFVSAELRLVR
jgi:hypothetical protein